MKLETILGFSMLILAAGYVTYIILRAYLYEILDRASKTDYRNRWWVKYL